MSLKSCIVALPLVTFCLIYKVACLVDPIVKITETNPPADLITHAVNANQGADVQMSCMVLNKPENYDVKWLLITNISSEIRLNSISTDTRSYNANKWTIDKPTPTTWRLKIHNVQDTDEGTYECRLQVFVQNWILFPINLHVVKSADVQQICDNACLDVYSPVCGSDGRTYSNGCYLSLANCGRPAAVHVTLASQGACGAAVVDVA
ncbi:uncharacterized protein LOC106065801 [Biomphalaria glabrata]|uniref:Uncharacterized protein LOC106065801 n=1 Tax=Biomphalaria glabrata TaxID=6526 RepID=A0A9W2ZFK6_BIOGL|nr:uncharacterized protein LOC106065801 [Biomphalaria glabrata]